MVDRSPPSYIDREIIGAPIDFDDDPHEHIGPVETVNKRFDDIGSKTTCGMLTQIAGILSWGAWRLEKKADVRGVLDLIEASFAFQIHPTYVDREVVPGDKPDQRPTAKAAAQNVRRYIRRALDEEDWWLSYYQPFDAAFHGSYLVRYILPKNKQRAFGKWLDAMLARVKAVAPKPKEVRKFDERNLSARDRKAFAVVDEEKLSIEGRADFYLRHWGRPLPPDLLDVSEKWQPDHRLDRVRAHLRSLDWKKNRCLRSPAEMKKRGFLATPYDYPVDEGAEREMLRAQMVADLKNKPVLT